MYLDIFSDILNLLTNKEETTMEDFITVMIGYLAIAALFFVLSHFFDDEHVIRYRQELRDMLNRDKR